MRNIALTIGLVAATTATLLGQGTATAEPEWDGYIGDYPASASLYMERQLDLEPRACTGFTYIGATGTSDTNEKRSPDEPAGRYIGAFGVELERQFEDVRSVWVPYPARAVFTSYQESVMAGEMKAESLIRAIDETCPETVFLLAGYSQGADVMTRVLEKIAAGDGPVSEDRISRAVLLANPRRDNPEVEFHGMADPAGRGILANSSAGYGSMTGRIVEICNDGDIWCDASPVHQTLGPVVTEASLRLQDAVAIAEVIEKFFGPDVIRAETFREDIESILDFAVSGTEAHLSYEDVSADGQVSMAQWALEYLGEGIS